MANAAQDDDLNKVKEDVASLRESLNDLSKQSAETARAQAESLHLRARENAERLASEASAKFREGTAAVTHEVEERPLTSVLIAFGVGLIVGKLFHRR